MGPLVGCHLPGRPVSLNRDSMRWVSVTRMRLRSLFFRSQVEQELDEELRYHLEREIDEKIAAGMKPVDARYAALQRVEISSNEKRSAVTCED